MRDRPENVTCALVGDLHGDGPETWCGRPVDGFVFQDVTHAARNGAQQGRLVLCEDCRDAIVKALSNGIDDEYPSPFVQVIYLPPGTGFLGWRDVAITVEAEDAGTIAALDEAGDVWVRRKMGERTGWCRISMKRMVES
jgi:hypothetical protein